MFELKPLSQQGVPAALEKAERYRLLGEPWEAESICRDILAVEANNQAALTTLILAITDQFGSELGGDVGEAEALVTRLEDGHDRAFYGGIVHERRAKDLLRHGTLGMGPAGYELLRRAMDSYEEAEKVSPPGNDSAILRWNTCARIIMRNNLRPAPGPPSAV